MACETARQTALAEVINCLVGANRPAQDHYKPFARELTEVAGISFKGAKVIISRTMGKRILERIRKGHLDINVCKQ